MLSSHHVSASLKRKSNPAYSLAMKICDLDLYSDESTILSCFIFALTSCTSGSPKNLESPMRLLTQLMVGSAVHNVCRCSETVARNMTPA